MKVPFFDLNQHHSFLHNEINEALQGVIQKSAFIMGDSVKTFEKNFAQYLDVPYCLGVASGTDALNLAFRALNIGSGDEVIVPAHTFVATAIGVMLAGATPVLVDVDPTTYLMAPSQLEGKITSKTKALCPVHLYGRSCNMDQISVIAKKHDLFIVEDAAQSHGSYWNSKRTGTWGDIGCFSFYPSKNLGAFGDGGALVVQSEEVATRIKQLRNYGSEIKYFHPTFGFNSRLDTIQAAVLDVKLKYLDAQNAKRWEAARLYVESFKKAGCAELVLPEILSKDAHVFHLFVVQVPDRDRIQAQLKEAGVDTGIHYPNPFYLEQGYTKLGYKIGDFPVTEKLSKRILSLPLFPEITTEQIGYVVDAVLKNI